jgi:uncharacterized MnhB-related membrane protein
MNQASDIANFIKACNSFANRLNCQQIIRSFHADFIFLSRRMSMWYVLVAAGILVCAVLAISAKRLLVSAIWLAVTSALVALMMYMLGAAQLAVIELSVGAGLVTVLFVFAINISGEEPLNLIPVMPKPLAWVW